MIDHIPDTGKMVSDHMEQPLTMVPDHFADASKMIADFLHLPPALKPKVGRSVAGHWWANVGGLNYWGSTPSEAISKAMTAATQLEAGTPAADVTPRPEQTFRKAKL